jgi:tRNA (cmo5U34)-methyltransferase
MESSEPIVGDNIATTLANWSFAGKVAQNFDTHVNKSVPFYAEGHELICSLCDFFLKENSLLYEIGCSTGTLLKKLSHKNASIHKNIKLIGIDVEQDMIDEATKKCSDSPNISLFCDDILNVNLEKCNVIIAYYTLQFVSPNVRQLIFDKIYNALHWGGAFILFEKTRACDARFQDIFTTLYIEYKQKQGYSDPEIIGKMMSLKGILEPFSTNGNLDLLKRAGFVDMITIMKYLSFEGFLAIK